MTWKELSKYVMDNPKIYYPNSSATLQETVIKILNLLELKEQEKQKPKKKGDK